ncbi:MAG TPA: hypothetical protein VGR53_11265 [Nitrososphaerales archaeon]|nr:hypothetical protein [Nitrososphaerales archaeon]
MRQSRVVLILVILAVVIVFVPSVPALSPCPVGAKCFFGFGLGSPSYVLSGMGAFGAYPIKDLRNESGQFIPVVNYFEGFYSFWACSKGAESVLLYGGPWGCDPIVSFYWNI